MAMHMYDCGVRSVCSRVPGFSEDPGSDRGCQPYIQPTYIFAASRDTVTQGGQMDTHESDIRSTGALRVPSIM